MKTTKEEKQKRSEGLKFMINALESGISDLESRIEVKRSVLDDLTLEESIIDLELAKMEDREEIEGTDIMGRYVGDEECEPNVDPKPQRKSSPWSHADEENDGDR